MNATSSECEPGRVGCELKALLASFGFLAHAGCGCASKAQWMDEIGVDECERRADHIVQFLAHKARSAGVPFARTSARVALRIAIARARKRAE